MIQIAQAGGKLSAPRPGSCNNYNRFCGPDVFIGSVTLVTYNQVDICRITFGRIMQIHFYSPHLELVLEGFGGRLILIAGNNHSTDIQSPLPEIIDGLEGINIIGYSEIGPYLSSFQWRRHGCRVLHRFCP